MNDMAAMPDSVEDARRANIERCWPRFRWDASGRSRWAAWSWNQYSFVTINGFLFSSILLEMALWKNGEKEWWLQELFAGSPMGRSVLVLLILTNGWLMERSLADRTPDERLVPGWLLWVRRALVSVPVAGVYGVPLWRWIIQARPSWVFRSSHRPSLELSIPSRMISSPFSHLRTWSDSIRRGQGQSFLPFTLWVVCGQVVPWIVLISWLTTAEALSPGRRAILIGLSVLCHVLASACGFQYAVIRGRQTRPTPWKMAGLRYAPLSFLFPFPAVFAGLLLWMASAGEEVETLTSRSHSNKTRPPLHISAAAEARFSRLPALIQRKCGKALSRLPTGSLEEGNLKSRQLVFCQIKAFLLFFDASALAWAAGRFGGRLLLRMDSSFSWLQIAPFLCLAALGVLVELALLALRMMGWLLRRKVFYQPYGRSVAISQLALAAGLLFGTLLAAGQPAVAGQLLMALGLGVAIVSTLILAPVSFLLELPGRRHPYLTMAWAVLFIVLSLMGAVMSGRPDLAPPILKLLQALLTLSPVLSLALFIGLKGWLLHPFELGHLLDRRLPGKARAALATVALTGALPLGGVAIPFWVYAHHRLWPRYEKLLWNLKENSSAGP